MGGWSVLQLPLWLPGAGTFAAAGSGEFVGSFCAVEKLISSVYCLDSAPPLLPFPSCGLDADFLLLFAFPMTWVWGCSCSSRSSRIPTRWRGAYCPVESLEHLNPETIAVRLCVTSPSLTTRIGVTASP